GMLHGLLLRGGRAVRYRSRWVRTPRLMELNGSEDDPDHSPANTNVVVHGGRILALEERHRPYEVTSDLDTVGPVDFDGTVRSLTAHPKICPRTGEMLAFAASPTEPHLTYLRFDRDGRLAGTAVIDLPRPVMMHDFAITSDHVVFMDLPIVWDLAASGGLPYRWDREHPARLGVMGRAGGAVQWFDIDPCYVFHTVNACEMFGRITLDACRYDSLWSRSSDRFDEPAMVHRWKLGLSDGSVVEETLFDVRCDFPRIDERLLGHPNRYAYVTTLVDEETGSVSHGHRVVRLDLVAGTSEHCHFGPSRYASEAVFVPRSAEAEEAEGYLLTVVYDAERHSSEVVVLAADAVGAGPLATVTLPNRVPYGFHCSWVPADA
ncbi:MAG: carotenoid oxygenase family protein, partial [Acidimicrobiia bacterium]|nr:carotenoid oxygenase family protein [Acidimicrobiia bacterium]